MRQDDIIVYMVRGQSTDLAYLRQLKHLLSARLERGQQVFFVPLMVSCCAAQVSTHAGTTRARFRQWQRGLSVWHCRLFAISDDLSHPFS